MMQWPRKRTPDASALFRGSLAAKLGSFRRDALSRDASVSGLIEHSGMQSRIVVTYMDTPLKLAPAVDCHEPWIRRSPTWHYENHNHCFCWVLQQEWARHFKERYEAGEPVGHLCSDAATWLVEAMRYVLGRHLIGHQTGMFEWPKEWEDYSHGEDGVKEYEEGKYGSP